MPFLGAVGRPALGLVVLLLAVPATASAAPVGSSSVHAKRISKRAGSALAFQAAAAASTTVNSMHVYLDRSSTARRIEVGMYRGRKRPQTRIRTCVITTPRAGWNSCGLSPAVKVSKRRTYWLALLLPRGAGGVIRLRNKRSPGFKTYVSRSSALRSLPASYRPGRRWRGVRASIYADRAPGSSAADSDGDGVPDAQDQCPTQAASTPNGCPAATPPPAVPLRSSNCMPDPSACGFPDVETTGVKPGTALAPASGAVTLSTPGMVYENRVLTGSIRVTAANVTIRNVKILKSGAPNAIQTNGSASAGLQIQDVEIDMQGDEANYGISVDQYTALRTYIHNGSDCAYMGTNVTMRDSFCSIGPDANNDGWADSTGFCSGTEHFDGYSSDGGSNQVYDHNTIRNPCSQTSAILISTNTSPISNVTITNNLMAGGGYTLYCAATDSGVGGTEVVTGNRIARTYRQSGGYWGPVAYCQSAEVFSGNVWDDTSQAIGRG